jgi:fructose-1-phosphate kinase PfkB-like protein
MGEGILAALITGGLSLVGVIISGLLTTKKTETAMKVAQAVTDTKLDELTREVRAHNNFAQRMPVVEEQIKAMNHRVGNLEQYHKQPLN